MSCVESEVSNSSRVEKLQVNLSAGVSLLASFKNWVAVLSDYFGHLRAGVMNSAALRPHLAPAAIVIVGLLLPSATVFATSQKPVTSLGRLSVVDSIVQQAIDEHLIPGAVVLIGHDGKVVYRK